MQAKEATELARTPSWELSHAGNGLALSTASVTFSPPHAAQGLWHTPQAFQSLDSSTASNLQRGMGPSTGASPLDHFHSHLPWQNTLICRHISRDCKVLRLDSGVVTQHTAWRGLPL